MDKILAIGECLIDFFGESSNQSIKQQKYFEKKFGGAPANVASVVASLGGKALLYSEVGCDQFGDYLVEKLQAFNVDTRYVKRVATATTLAFVSLTSQGERDFVFVPGAGYQMDYQQIALPSNDLSIIHFGGAFALKTEKSRKSYHRLLAHYQQLGKRIVFDPNYRTAFWQGQQALFASYARPLAELADIVKLSEEEAMILTQTDSIDEAVTWLRQQLTGLTLVTMGARGCRVVSSQFDFIVPAPQVKVVDTTGAGDAFVGALLYHLAERSDNLQNTDYLRDIVTKANQIAADVCTVKGALGYFEKSKDF